MKPDLIPENPRRFGRRFAPVNNGPSARVVATDVPLVAVTDPQLGVTAEAEKTKKSDRQLPRTIFQTVPPTKLNRQEACHV